jgi:hypothetical protein
MNRLLRNVWMATGLIVYLAIALFLPVTVRVLEIFSDIPSTWPRLLIPFLFIPFLMGFAQALFLVPWRLLLWSPAVVMAALAVFSIVDDLKRPEFLSQDLIFWPVLLVCYLICSWLGKYTRERMKSATPE